MVFENAARAQSRCRNVVQSGDQAGPLAERRERDAAGANCSVIGTHGEEFAVGVERQGDIRDQVTALIVGRKRSLWEQEATTPGCGGRIQFNL